MIGKRGILSFIFALLLSGCAGLASYQAPFTTATVGPVPTLPSKTPPGTGRLEVYTATDSVTDRSGYVVASPQNYRLRSADGSSRVVRNQNYLNPVREPRPITLPAGSYTVVAPADTYRTATVPIVIASGKVTIVNLDDQTFPAARPTNPQSAVEAPDGYLVGWKAQ